MGQTVFPETLQGLSLGDVTHSNREIEQIGDDVERNRASVSVSGSECQEDVDRRDSSFNCSPSRETGEEYLCYFMHRLLSFR